MYSDLVKQNSAAHSSVQISRAELAIDKGLEERIERDTQKKLEETKNELAWTCQRKELLLQNFKTRYLIFVQFCSIFGFFFSFSSLLLPSFFPLYFVFVFIY